MSSATATDRGAVVSLWRYPVKSMMGEEVNRADLTERGLLGDRACALVDRADGKVATAKNPRKWPHLFDFRATLVAPPQADAPLPPVRITLPNGTTLTSDQGDRDQILSAALHREVRFERVQRGPGEVSRSALSDTQPLQSEEYWPDMDGLDYRDTVTDFPLPEGTFFDLSVVHVLTTATLDRLRELYPEGRFEARRFRPNVVVETADGAKGFVEQEWIGRTLAIGEKVRLRITGPCPRCVMTTLPQGDLPGDLGVLRTAVEHNGGNVGVYAAVLRGGTIRRGDLAHVE